jgi:prevent-host-death family protein
MYYVFYIAGDGMRQVTAREANQHFAKVLSAVEGGEQVLISKRGKPVAVMSPYKPALDAEHQAAVERMIASMDEPVELRVPFRTFTRDEMHER